MIFLNSLWLWGSLAMLGASLPVLIHLLNKARPKKVEWPAMVLLMRTAQKRNRQVKLEDWLIMLLRSLALLFAALAMLRPAILGAGGLVGQSPRDVVIAIDGSYSMMHGQFTPRFALALEQARAIAKDLPSESNISLVLMGDSPDIAMRHAPFDRNLIDKRLEQLEARPASLALEANLAAIDELVAAAELPNKAVYIITDAQLRNWDNLSSEARRLLTQIGEAAATTIMPVTDGTAENLSVSNLQLVSGVRRLGGFANFTAAVTNHGASPAQTSVTLMEDGQAVDMMPVGPLAPGEQQLVRFSVQLDEAGQRRFEAMIDEDHLAIDNRTARVVGVQPTLPVLLIDGEPSPADPSEAAGFFIDLALQLRRSGYATGLDVAKVASYEAQPTDIARAQVIILANVGDLPIPAIDALQRQVERGAGLLIYAGDQVDSRITPATFGELFPTAEWLTTITPDMNARQSLAVKAVGHPLGQELLRLQEDLADVTVSGYHRVRPSDDAQSIVELTSGEPLIIERNVGRGRAVLVTTGPGRDWSSLPVSAVGPILVHLLVGHLSSPPFTEPVAVGQPMQLIVERAELGVEAKVFRPDGEIRVPELVESQSDDQLALLSLGLADSPGFYELQLRPDLPSQYVAANVEANEGAVQAIDATQLQAALADTGITVASADAAAQAGDSAHLNNVGLWRWLALLAVALMIAQAFLSALFTRRKARGAKAIRTGYGVGVGGATPTTPAHP